MAVGNRFDFEAAREEARAKKRAERTKKIVSNCVLALVITVVGVGGKIGWDKYVEKRAEAKAAAEAAALAAERAEAERQRKQAAERAAAEAARERERKQREEARERERKEREEARERERREHEEERRRAEEAKKREQEFRQHQQELKAYAERAVLALAFDAGGLVQIESGCERWVETEVDGERWSSLAAACASRQELEMFELLRDKSITNDFSGNCYPEKEVVEKLLDNLNRERFTLVVRLAPEAVRSYRHLSLVAADKEKGLTFPDGARALKDRGGRVTGWTVPFVYGMRGGLFLMSEVSIRKLNREWRDFVAKVRRDSQRLTNKQEYVDSRLTNAIYDFGTSVRVELRNPPPDPEEEKREQAKKRASKPKLKMRGTNSDIKTMKGSRSLSR